MIDGHEMWIRCGKSWFFVLSPTALKGAGGRNRTRPEGRKG